MAKQNEGSQGSGQEPDLQGSEGDVSASEPPEDSTSSQKPPEGSPPTPTPQDDPPATPQTPFSLPGLEGLTEEQIAQELAAGREAKIISDATIKSQGQRLTQLERDRAQPTVVDAPPEEVSSQDWFADPATHTRSMIREELEAVVAPLRADLSRNTVKDAWSELDAKYPDVANYRGYIDEKLLVYGNGQAPTFDSLQALYTMARGEASIAGIAPAAPAPTSTPTPDQRISPQLRPSSHPIKTDEPAPPRQLTEEERNYARSQEPPMSDNEFLHFLEIEEDDVAETVFEKEKVS